MQNPFISDATKAPPPTPAARNGAEPGAVHVQEKNGVAVVDVEQRRYDQVELILNRFVGRDESFALAKMSRFRRQGVSNFLALVRLYSNQGVDLSDMMTWGLDQIKGDLKPQKTYERAADNLTKQTGEKPGLLDRWFGGSK